ncbi:MAG: hypothetical protein HY037_02555 [Nitrospirae bacterium]|nr:hypothetical protein [Candidatus Troglogloeales bacterium]
MKGWKKPVKEHTPNNMPDMMQGGETDNLGDRYISVPSECQAIYRVVPSNETVEMSNNIGSSLFHVPAFPSLASIDPSEKLYEKRDEIDADLVELLLCLDWKMNLLIKMLAPQQDETVYPYRAAIKEISVGNLKIGTRNPLAIGTVLEFHFVLPILPFKELFLRGEVAKIGAHNLEEYDISLHSHLFKESDREHLIRYVVRRQFQIKRENPRKQQWG